jgi:hypothetical protein
MKRIIEYTKKKAAAKELLWRIGLEYIEDIPKFTDDKLRAARNVGPMFIQELRNLYDREIGQQQEEPKEVPSTILEAKNDGVIGRKVEFNFINEMGCKNQYIGEIMDKCTDSKGATYYLVRYFNYSRCVYPNQIIFWL